jgi:exosortase A-associated hydrolase 2
VKPDVPQLEAGFLEGRRGRLFYVMHAPPPSVATRGGVLLLPPFLEEMNKARRMLALQARSLAAAGYLSLLVDYFGTGDSEGELEEADLEGWQVDVETACDTLLRRAPGPKGVIALRAGALLLAPAFKALEPAVTVLWAPISQGARYRKELYRAAVLSARLAGEERSTQQLEERVRDGLPVDVLGYRLGARWLLQLGEASAPVPPEAGSCVWIDVNVAGAPSPASVREITSWSRTATVRHEAQPGPSFWATQEIAELPALLDGTVRALRQGLDPHV